MKTLVILLLATAASAGLIGSKKCTWGPTYWCQGFQTSRECFATTHCIENVWSERNYPEDNDDVCTICKNMVKEARDTLRSNLTQEELKEVFEGSCDLIPIKVVAEGCKKLSDEFIPELIESLSSEMNPDTVCAVAGLCNSAKIDKLLAEANAPKTDCDVCRAETNNIAQAISGMEKNVVQDKMLEICGHFSSYSDACRYTVTENFDVIYKTLLDLNGGVCDLSGMCSESFKNVPAVYSSNKPADVQCEFCEKVIQHWVDTWTANTTEEEFKTVLEALCKKLDKPSRVEHCLHIVDDWYLPWFNFILHEVDPHELCSLVGLCTQQSSTPLMRLQPAQRLSGNDESNYAKEIYHQTLQANIAQGKLIGGYFTPKTVVATSKPGCAICEYTLHEIQDILANDKTEANVEAALHKVCARLPHSVEDQCDQFVNTYAPAIIQLLIHEIDPSEICSRLDLCPADILAAQASLPTPALQVIVRQSQSCVLCEYAMDTLFSVLNDTSDQEMVKNVLDQMCYKLMPSSLKNECQKFVAEYTNQIIDLVIQSYTPTEICNQIRMCVRSPDFKVIPMNYVEEEETFEVSKDDKKCIFCEFVISKLDEIIGDKKNEAKIEAALHKVCNYMPGSLKDECTNYVDTYGEMIIEMITHDIPPEQICQKLKLCPQTADEDEVEGERPYCTLCEYAIGEVDKLIEDKQNEEEIKNVLDRICYELSTPIQKECVNMVNAYTDEIVQMFVNDYTPQEVCAELQLCKPTEISDYYPANNDLILTNDIPPMEEEVDVSGKGVCVMCEFFVEVLEKQVLTNRTFDMTKRAVQMVCSYMPETVAEKCEDFVDEYGDEIIQFLVDNELQPKEFCAQLQLCPEDEPTLATNLGGNQPCVWGPAFWCQSPFHAKACGTTEHCKRYVWNQEN